MAAADLNPSRREVLGAAFAVPVLARTPSVRFERSREAVPSAAEVLHRRWTGVLARFRHAEAALIALEGHPDEGAFGRAHDRFNACLRRLLAAPAPDIAALATKPVLSKVEGLEVAVAAELADLTYAPPALAALAEDARRLSGA